MCMKVNLHLFCICMENGIGGEIGALILSHHKVGVLVMGMPCFDNKEENHEPSILAFAKALYLASLLDGATIVIYLFIFLYGYMRSSCHRDKHKTRDVTCLVWFNLRHFLE